MCWEPECTTWFLEISGDIGHQLNEAPGSDCPTGKGHGSGFLVLLANSGLHSNLKNVGILNSRRASVSFKPMVVVSCVCVETSTMPSAHDTMELEEGIVSPF